MTAGTVCGVYGSGDWRATMFIAAFPEGWRTSFLKHAYQPAVTGAPYTLRSCALQKTTYLNLFTVARAMHDISATGTANKAQRRVTSSELATSTRRPPLLYGVNFGLCPQA